MCLSCGCNEYTERHPGSRSLVWSDIQAAAKDADITPDEVARNITHGVHAMEEKAEKSMELDDFLRSVRQDEIASVLKASDEQRFLLCVVYSPHRMPLRGADKRTDLARPDVLEKACWAYSAKGLGTGMWHEAGHGDEAVCVENYVYRGPDWVVKDAKGNEQVIKAGTWLAGYVLSAHAWDLYKSDRIGGVSLDGRAGRKPASAEALALVRS